jgi:hypothetical protein
MRFLVLALAVLAGMKVWYQDNVYREAAELAVAAAYSAQAGAACKKAQPANPVANTVDWSAPQSFHLVAGNRDLPVQFWQVDHALWKARFKNPYLVLNLAAPEGAMTCTYDITGGAATVSQM